MLKLKNIILTIKGHAENTSLLVEIHSTQKLLSEKENVKDKERVFLIPQNDESRTECKKV